MAFLRRAVAAAAILTGPVLAARKNHVEVQQLLDVPDVVETADKEAEVGDYKLHIKGKSGRFSVYNTVKGQGRSGIDIQMDALRELDANGNVVGGRGDVNQINGGVKHSIETFAGQDFTIVEAPLGLYDGVDTLGVHFESAIKDVGKVAVETYIVKQEGEMGPPGEKWSVHKGDVKWNIYLAEWKWCEAAKNNCQDKAGKAVDGAFVELDIKVSRRSGKKMRTRQGKGKPDRARKGGKMKEEEVVQGEDPLETETLELSKQVEVDGEWKDMPEGYPKVTVIGQSTVFTFRFPKFRDMILYDPLISESGNTGSSAGTRAAVALAAPLLAALAMLFA